MKKRYLLIFLLWPFLTVQAQDNPVEFVLQDTIITFLNNVDQDTALFVFPGVPLPTAMQSDTTKAGTRAYTPWKYARASGNFTLWLDRTNQSGAADSVRLYYFPLHPITGYLAKNDSTFLIGGASTFGTFVSGSKYTITLDAGKGIGFVIRQGDLTAVRTRVRFTLLYSQ